MKKNFISFLGFLVVATIVAASVGLNGCKNPVTASLYNPNQEYLPNPVIDSLTPSGSALAGIDTVTIYGKYFAADKDSELVYFIEPAGRSNDVSTPTIISATTTRLTVVAPALSGDSIQVRVAVYGALLYGIKTYSLVPAVAQFGGISSSQMAYSVCAGPDTSLYIALTSSNVDRGIFKVTSTGMTAYAPATSGLIGWSALRFGSGGYLYAVRGNRAIYRFPAGGNAAAQVWASASSGSFNDIDFDANENLWVAGSGGNIIMITPGAAKKTFPFSGTVSAVRYYNGYLYIAANQGSPTSHIFRAPVMNDSLGTAEDYFDLSSDPSGGSNIYALTFSADGNMYVGVDSSDYLIVVNPVGQIERPYAPYVASGVLNSPCKSFTWIGTYLYASTLSGELLQIVPRKEGAPYYGIQ